MADEEKKPDISAAAKEADAAAPKEIPSPTVSHTEPAAVHSDAPVPPLAGDKGHDSHGHDDHAHGHDDQAHSASGAEFGEVIPEKNWQDSLLAAVAFMVLCGFLLVGAVWLKVQPPPEHEQATTTTTQSAEPAPALVPPVALPKPTFYTENPRKPTAH